MDFWINILFYISIFSGGLLVLLMLLSFIGGMDLDFGDTDIDSGGLGVVKSVLTFLSVSAWVAKVILATSDNVAAAMIAAAVAGIIAVFILSMILKLLLKNQKFVHWDADMAIGKKGTTYLKIPAEGNGIVHVVIDNTKRELKAKSDGNEIPTGAQVYIQDFRDGYLIVSEIE